MEQKGLKNATRAYLELDFYYLFPVITGSN